jgi:hypothetical protein
LLGRRTGSVSPPGGRIIMIKILSGIGLVVVILIIGGIATCSVHSKLLSADAAIQPALDEAALNSKPLLAALDAYHHEHGFFPTHIEDLRARYGLPADYVYEVLGAGRVYDSFECASHSGEFYGVIKDPAAYHQRLVSFLRQCVSGYAAFVLKSPRIHTQRSVNSNTVAFARFGSQDGRWQLDWCESQAQRGTDADCRHFPMNEAPMFFDSDRKATHKVVYVSRHPTQEARRAQ